MKKNSMMAMAIVLFCGSGCEQYDNWQANRDVIRKKESYAAQIKTQEAAIETDKVNATNEIKVAVRKILLDPDSAKFGSVYIESSPKKPGKPIINSNLFRACITVNSKNSYGGYSGDQQAMAFMNEQRKWEVVYIHNHDQETCKKFLEAQYPVNKYGYNNDYQK